MKLLEGDDANKLETIHENDPTTKILKNEINKLQVGKLRTIKNKKIGKALLEGTHNSAEST